MSKLKITEVTCSHGLTINMGDFNSARVDVSMTSRVEEDMDAEEVFAELDDLVLSKVIEKQEELLGE